MEGFGATFERFGSSGAWRTDSLKNFQALSPPVQRHLQKVYGTLAGALLCCTVGVYLHVLYNLGGLLSSLGMIGSIVWLLNTPSTAANEGKRVKLLAAAALCQGLTIGPLVAIALDFDPRIVVTALLGSAAVFGCFSGAALLSRRREFLFLGGVLSSALSTMAVLRLASLFVGGSASLFHLELYGGLLIFVGYVLFDTQMIVERASRGDRDYIKHSLDLFVDFIAVFVRLLIILMRNNDAAEKKRNEKVRRGAYTVRR